MSVYMIVEAKEIFDGRVIEWVVLHRVMCYTLCKRRVRVWRLI